MEYLDKKKFETSNDGKMIKVRHCEDISLWLIIDSLFWMKVLLRSSAIRNDSRTVTLPVAFCGSALINHQFLGGWECRVRYL